MVVIAGGKNATVIPNWKVDPRCPYASNPFHMCAQYCFDHLSETAQTSATKSGVCQCFYLFILVPTETACAVHMVRQSANSGVTASGFPLVAIFMLCDLSVYFQTREEARVFLQMSKEEKSTLIVSTHPIPTTSVVTTARERVIGRRGR